MANRFFPNYDRYIITSRFGQRVHPVDGVKKMHNGIDLVATMDGKTGQVDKIMSHTGGTVDAVGYTSTVGYYINIRVSGNTVMVYRHLRDMPTLKKGETVKTGQIIGKMGKTGKATARHLHWGIKVDGKWIDPAPYLDSDYPETPAVKMITLEVQVLKRGMKGGSVWSLQSLLLGFGYELGDTGAKKDGVDGSFGSKTEEALKKYQYENDLEPDGSCGLKTWSSLLCID
jgi:hypothetical protein